MWKERNIEKLLLIGGPIIVFILSSFVFDFNGLYGQDSHAYYQYAKELKEVSFNFSETGFFYWPKVFPILGAALSYLGFSVLFSFQIISLFSLIISLWVANKIIKLLYHKNGYVLLFLGAVLEVYFVRGGIILMSDMFAALLVITAFFFYLKSESSRDWRDFLLTLLFSFLAVLSRYACLPLVIVPVLFLIINQYKSLNLYLKISVGLGAILSGLIIFQLNDLFYGLGKEIINQWSYKNIFSRVLYNENGKSVNTVPNVFYVLGNWGHLGYLSFGVLMTPFFSKLKKANKVIMLSLGVYLLFLVGLPTQNYRFILISHLLVLIAIYPLFYELVSFLKQKNIFKLFVLGVVFFNVSFFFYSFSKTYRVFTTEKEVVQELKSIQKGEDIYSFYVDQSFNSYGLNNEVINFYFKELDHFQKGALVVFNPEKFKEQWKGSNVMKNWNNLNSNYNLDTLSVLNNNWIIYRIK